MSSSTRSFFTFVGALAFVAMGLFFLTYQTPADTAPRDVARAASTSAQAASAHVSRVTPSPASESGATSVLRNAPIAEKAEPTRKEAADEATRINAPYPFPTETIGSLNKAARLALVNILCTPSGGSLKSISGSGVIIDPRGVILTNAHVAQYILLSESARLDLSCTVRTGAPAVERWVARVLYMPPVWVETHAHEISMDRPMSTGEHDYALLLITRSVDGTPLPSFPHLPVDTRETIAFTGDQVMVASYPAEFQGDSAAQFSLYPVSSITSIGRLFTFTAKTVDLLSLGGVAEAQSGSSGGAILNMWGRLVGLIATASEGDTTADRDLRALTLSYIDRDLVAQTTFTLPMILAGDVRALELDFNTRAAPRLIDLYLKNLNN